MEVTLSPELEALIAEQVESGHYPSPGEVVRDALRLLQDKLELPGSKLESLRRDVQAGLQALDQGEYDEYEDPRQLAAEIKARGRHRLESLVNGAALRGTAGSHTAGGDQLPGGSPEKNTPL